MSHSSKTQELIDAAKHLPAEDRAALVDSLLKTLDPPEAIIDNQWLALAQERLADIEQGKAALASSEDVFARLKDRLKK